MWILKNLFCMLMLLVATGAMAQKADMRVGELLNNGDWFELEKEYPVMKDSV